LRREVLHYLQSNKDLLQFVREEPKWYRYLSRNPYDLNIINSEAKKYYKKTIPDRIHQIADGVQMASMMMSMFSMMNNQK